MDPQEVTQSQLEVNHCPTSARYIVWMHIEGGSDHHPKNKGKEQGWGRAHTILLPHLICVGA